MVLGSKPEIFSVGRARGTVRAGAGRRSGCAGLRRVRRDAVMNPVYAGMCIVWSSWPH